MQPTHVREDRPFPWRLLVVRTWAGAQAGAGWVNVAGAGVVAVLCTLALGVAWRALAGTARRPRLFPLALMAGIAITGTLLPLLNRLLAAGVLAEPLAGAPWLVHLVTLASAVGVVLGMRWLARPLRA